MEQLRAGATTEPGRLRIIGAALVLLVVAFGAVSAVEASDRFTAADDVVRHSQPLSRDAANIYRSLADADTQAASGFLAGAQDPPEVLKLYQDDIRTASSLLVKAAATTSSSSESGRQIAAINEGLPRYTGLIERARAANRQGLPLGGAYLRYANEQMTRELLPAAEKLYGVETARLDQDNDDARLWPFASLAVGVVTFGGLFWAQRRNYRRTNRVFNQGMLAATAASTVLLLWLAVGHTIARSDLNAAEAKGQRSLAVLNDARINSLKARANENLTEVARGAVLTADGKNDKYEADFNTGMAKLSAALRTARGLADDSAGSEPVGTAIDSVAQWQERHTSARAADQAGDYKKALDKIIGPEGTTGQSFDQVNAALGTAIDHEQGEFTASATSGRSALTGLAAGAAVLGLLGAAGAALGMGRRLSEYR
ncbi:hypothetical protein [Streptomyces sp. 150FB]|uniref:hypothetical protein n=1 Tax=Streptomyces sp. 150FB TaxID=1576605 RepID=UPI000ABCC191|nr:hypothetical protein [Streptomyces sp. 150FB]